MMRERLESTGGPTIADAVQEIHTRVEDFRRAYNILSAKFPDRFPHGPIIQTRINAIFTAYLRDGKITQSPVGRTIP